MTKYSGIIFDFNGVLLWDTHLHEQVWRDYSRTLRGTPLSQEEIRHHVHGRPNQYIIEYLIGKWFEIDKIVLDDGTLPGKPEPDIYLRAAENIGISPSDCVVVEDSVSGICAAKRAGIGKIYALGPKEQYEELKALEGTSEVISHLGEIPTDLFSQRNQNGNAC